MNDPTTGGGAWFIRLSGEVRVEGDQPLPAVVRGRQAPLVLALLAVERRAVLREEIAELLWGEAPLPDHWPNDTATSAPDAVLTDDTATPVDTAAADSTSATVGTDNTAAVGTATAATDNAATRLLLLPITLTTEAISDLTS